MAHTILIVDDEVKLLDVLGGMLEQLGYRALTASSGEAALDTMAREAVDLVLCDLRMPGMGGREVLTEMNRRGHAIPLVIMTAYSSVRDAVGMIKEGAFDYIDKPIELDDLTATLSNALRLQDALRDNQRLRDELQGRYSFDTLIGSSPAFQKVLRSIAEVCEAKTTVLITGESGTGKEVVARRIHCNSPRRSGPFVAVNCAAIPEALLESELFGHVKGAFTGASRAAAGASSQADGGTLFLDEIGDMPLALQAKLLRVLQERTFEPVGGDPEQDVDVRIIAATNRDLERDGRERRVPRGPLLPPERLPHRAAATARATGRPPPVPRPLPRRFRCRSRASRPAVDTRGVEGPRGLWLAGQHSRAAELHGALGPVGAKPGDRRRRPATLPHPVVHPVRRWRDRQLPHEAGPGSRAFRAHPDPGRAAADPGRPGARGRAPRHHRAQSLAPGQEARHQRHPPRRIAGMIVETLLKSALADAVREGSLSVTFASGRLLRFGDGSGEDLAIRFTDAGAERAMLLDPDLRFGELYMDGRLVLERGSIFALLRLFYANAEERPQPLLSRMVDATRFRLRRLARSNLPGRARANVAHHYDLDSRLFRLFLDQDMQYSCAWFPSDDATLEEAQEAKKHRIAAKLALAQGQTVLDIGCGWGGLALHLAARPEAPVVDGITLSTEQLGTAQRRAAEAGLADRVRVRLEDYRAVKGPYDRIVSVGMFEHVGAAFYPTFFRHVARLLKPDGAMLLHTIGSLEAPGFVTPWLDKYIFPGGDIPSLSEIVPAIERAGLVITDVEVLRLHYALTLREWSRRFQARRQEAAALYDERLCRMWEFYLAAAECAFRHENLAVFQIQLARRARTLPIRRDYMEAGSATREPAAVS